MKKNIIFGAVILFFCVQFSLNGNDFVTYASYQQKALEAKNWNKAIKFTSNMISNADDSYVIASSFLQLGSLFLITGNKNNAAAAIRKSIQIMGNSENIDMTMIAVAKKLLSKTNKFSLRLNNREINILANYIERLSNSASIIQNGIDLAERSRIANMQHNLLMQQYNNQINMIKKDTQWFERNAKFNARRDYRESTGNIFDPKYRPTDESARRHWDSAKRVYDIFD